MEALRAEDFMEAAPARATAPARPQVPPLAALAADPDRLGAILRGASAVFPDHPALRNALVTWLVLLAARKTIPPDPRGLAYGLWSQGWKLLEPTEKPRPGDVFLFAGPDRNPTHVGVVAKVSTCGTWFLAIDDATEPGQPSTRRDVAGVASWLRFT